ncbi:MFS family permease [Mycoplana sp. BE70]|uniref:MFS transporter n=1 Tax=Mycoplana sp. BE70 TaxID=2817775 RepID=UPI0028551F2F|nr:MFS transporter [Mycoplana sp. BE70]MDR6756682.1 MFS family permease [Mycoplana sp. BE70]
MNATIRTKSKPSVLAALAGAMLLASLGVSIATVALPTLTREFSAPLATVQWIVLAYLIAVTVTIVLAGRLGDLFGQRRVLIAGLALFAVASVLCAAAPTLGLLIAGRAMQGIGGAILMALPLSLIRETISRERTGSAMGLLGTMSAIGTALGPSLGGVLIASSGWRAAFVALAGAGFLVLGIALRAIPPTPVPVRHVDGRMDWPGAALLAVTLILYGLATAGGTAAVIPGAGMLLPAAILGLALFVFVEIRSASPLVPVSVLLERATGSALAMNILVSTVMMATLVVGPFFLSFSLGLNEAVVGLVMAIGPVTAALSGVLAGRVTDRFGARSVLAAGLVEMTVGLVCLAVLPRLLGVAGFAAALIVLTPGFQLFLTANNTAVMVAVRDDQRGLLSGLLGLSRNLGFMTGASVMATLFAAAVGSSDIVATAPDVIANAFTTTFLSASGLTLLALIVAIVGQPAAAEA